MSRVLTQTCTRGPVAKTCFYTLYLIILELFTKINISPVSHTFNSEVLAWNI